MGSTAVVEVVPRVAQRWMGTSPTPTSALIIVQRSVGDREKFEACVVGSNRMLHWSTPANLHAFLYVEWA